MGKTGIRDMGREIGWALHNVRVRLTPSWTPMVYIVMNSKVPCISGDLETELSVERTRLLAVPDVQLDNQLFTSLNVSVPYDHLLQHMPLPIHFHGAQARDTHD